MIIGLTGYARSGKDSAANYLVEKYGYTKLAFADGVRALALGIDPYVDCGANRHYTTGDTPFARYSEVLKTVGYEAAKAMPDVRRLLQRAGTEGGREVFGDDVWVMALAHRLKEKDTVISDVRFPNEAAFIQSQGGFVIRVSRPGFGGSDPHPSEAQIATLDVDAEISATNLDELYAAIEDTRYMLLDRVHMPQETEDAPVPPPAVYLAGSWANIVQMGEFKQQMVASGLDVISDWTEREADENTKLVARREAAIIDMQQVRDCTALVIVNTQKSEGKATELGIALGLGKRVILVGERNTNVFYDLPQVEQVDSIEEAIVALGGILDYNRPIE